MIYTVVLLVHSWVRWVAVLAIVGRIGLALSDRSSGRDYDKRARGSMAGTVGLLDLMLVLGLMLVFWLSPLTTAAMGDMGAAMGDPLRRFWLVEHPTVMFLAVTVGHVVSVLARRQADAKKAHTQVAIGLSLVLLLILAGIPWPGRELIGRPLFAF